jgi:membrane-associated phospholipid phosphatase
VNATTTPHRWWGAAAVAAAGIFATYAVAVWTPMGQVLDTQAMLATEQALGTVWWADLLLEAISPASVFAALCLVAAGALALRGTTAATTAAATVVGTLLGSEVLKHLLVRPSWVDDTGNSLPSGHVSAVAAIAVAAYVAVPVAARHLAAFLGLGAVLTTATATMALGWHRPSDAVASILLAVGVYAVAAGLTETHERENTRPGKHHATAGAR